MKSAFLNRVPKWAKKAVHIFGVSALLLCLIAVTAVLSVSGAMVSSVNSNQKIVPVASAESDGADCILVLGAGLRKDGTPSDMLRDRLLVGIELYESGAAPKILMSGDHGSESYNEVGAMKTFAVDAGVPEEDIFCDHAGFSTYESLYRAKEIFGAEKIIVVTQQYHLIRALYIAGKLELDAHGVSADLNSYAGAGYREARESLARFKDFFYSLYKPEPTYLGEKIPLDGVGNDGE